MGCNKFSGKSWWTIIEHLSFIIILFLLLFGCIPMFGIGLSYNWIAEINEGNLCLYNGLVNINVILFLFFMLMYLLFYFPLIKIWKISIRFRKHLYYHGKTKPKEKMGQYIESKYIWEEFPPTN